MKRSTLSLLGILSAVLLSSTSASAQSSSISTNATIITPLTAKPTAALDFGSISKGSTATVSSRSRSAGGVVFSGDEGDNVTISIPQTVKIVTSSGEGASMTVDLDLEDIRVATSPNQEDSERMGSSKGGLTTYLSIDKRGDGTGDDGLGQAYLWIGGSVTPDRNQQRGDYSGEFTVTAAYSN